MQATPDQPGTRATAELKGRWRLPAQRLRLIGREHERSLLTELLGRADVGMVTITGPAGVGKTRLAVAAADDLLHAFADGVALADLAALRDPDLVIAAIARAVGVAEIAGVPLLDTVCDMLRDRRVLLLVDNFEQVLPAAPVLGELLAQAAGLKMLVTSRVAPPVYGAFEVAVEPLDVPDLQSLRTALAGAPADALALLERVPSVALLVERARAAQQWFALTPANALDIAAICAHLDGLPLALELAASRLKLLSPAALRSRLDRRFAALDAASSGRPSHHRTLHGAIELSYLLLTPAAQLVFRRYAVFAGGATLAALTEVCSTADGGEPTVLDTLALLVDHSLLRRAETAGEPRFAMLETIHEYALERLVASGEELELRRRHAAYFLELARQADAHFDSATQQAWFDRLAAEQDNLRAVLAWQPTAPDDRRYGLRLAGMLMRFWSHRDGHDEGRHWLEAQLGRNPDGAPEDRALALTALGQSLEHVCPAHARSVLKEALGIAPVSAATRAQAFLLLGRIERHAGEYADAQTHLAACFDLARRSGAAFCSMMAGLSLADIALDQGAAHTARRFSNAVLELTAVDVYPVDHTWALVQLGRAASIDDDLPGAQAAFEHAVSRFRELKNTWGVVEVLCDLGYVALARGDTARAAQCFAESLESARGAQAARFVAPCLEGIAALNARDSAPEQTLRLLGAAVRQRELLATAVLPVRRGTYERVLAEARSRVTEAAADTAWAAGSALQLEQAAAEALAVVHGGVARATAPQPLDEQHPRSHPAPGVPHHTPAREPAAQLTVRLLGGFDVRVDGEPAGFRSDKVRALLAYLAVERGRPHQRAHLAALLWPEQSDELALRNLSQTLVYLRAAIDDAQASPPRLVITRQTIQWNAESTAELDVAAFARLASGTATKELEQAAALYGGAFLAGFNVRGCPEFDEWLLLAREYWERRASSVLDMLAQAYLASSTYGEAERAARRHLELDPWNESAHRQLMHALAGAGQRAAALEHYECCRAVLADELGIEPDAETTAVAEAIRAAATPASSVADLSPRRHARTHHQRPPSAIQAPSLLPKPVQHP